MNAEFQSVAALLSAARSMEAAAAARLRGLAAAMRARGNLATAELFDRLAAEEDHHGAAVEDLADRLGETAPPAVVTGMPEAIGDEDLADSGGLNLLTPYKALTLAVRSEEHAFAFFVRVASGAADPRLRTHAEGLAKEELRHIALLRLERRRAFRAENRVAASVRAPVARSREELAGAAAALEGANAETLQGLAGQIGADSGVGAFLTGLAARALERAALMRAGRVLEIASLQRAGFAAAFGSSMAHAGALDPPAADALRGALRRAEERFEFYAATAESAEDEGALDLAHVLQTGAVGDIALIQQLLEQVQAAPQP